MATAMTVKDVSRTTGLSRETLRYYENAGLLREPRRGSNGYRYFDEGDLDRLEFILKTKKAGFKIREIGELISLKGNGNATCRLGRDIALGRIRKVDEQIASLTEVRAILVDFAERCEAEGLDEPCSLSFHLGPVSR
jgi:MerR family Zn(II)-responsive transcriptional regulator of zntA